MSITNSSSSSSSSQLLPAKEASLFKKILKHFKEKQFKNGLKICNQILSNPKFAEHGETLSMKGLILNSMGKKQEALDYVRRGLKNDVKSHVCWHVFGLLQKADHKYEEAIKCYRNALRLKKDSVQILSDLSLVQIQTRDLEGYRDSRYQLFLLRPGERSTWIGCAMAYHLTGDHMVAVNILSEYQKSSSTGNNFRNSRTTRRQINEIYEHSELLLYNVSILLECGRYEEALTLLDEHESDIVDKLSYFEYKCHILLALNRFDEAQKVLTDQLIQRNPESVSYFQLLEKANQVFSDEEPKRLKLYDDLSQLYPRSQTIARFPLTFVVDLNVFQQKMGEYLKSNFRRGRPALFRDLKNLYHSEISGLVNSFVYTKLVDLNHQEPRIVESKKLSRSELESYIKQVRTIRLPPKIEIIENLLLNYLDNLTTNGTFDQSSNCADESNKESVTCLLWVYYFFAQHFDALKEFSVALHLANCALVHTPTLIDIFVIKAKIFKHAGYLEKAVKCLDEAQSLDTSDRYLNSKCAKYMIRVNKIKEAEEMCLKFTREGVSATENLNEMQCMWFQNEVAKAYQRLGLLGEALKKCVEVDNHFAEINEDQFDFNTYCILKVTLRAYVQMIRLEDCIKSHRFFINAAKTAVEIYLRLYDQPISEKSEDNNEADSNLSASELRKMKNKQRKALLKAQATAEKENDKSQKKLNDKRGESDGSRGGGGSGAANETAEYIDPSKLEKTEHPLQDSGRFLNPARVFGRELIEIHFLAFEVYYRKRKLLLQLQCLKRSYRICASQIDIKNKHYPTLLRQTCLFLNSLISRKEQLNEALCLVFSRELIMLDVFGVVQSQHGDHSSSADFIFSKLPTVEDFVEKYLPSDSKSFAVRIENIRVTHQLSKFNNEYANVNQNDINVTNNNNDVNSNDVEKKLALPVAIVSEPIRAKLSKLINEMNTMTNLSLESCQRLFELVATQKCFGQVPDDLIESMRQNMHSLYPYASMFMDERELNELDAELALSDFFTAEPEEYNNCNPGEEN